MAALLADSGIVVDYEHGRHHIAPVFHSDHRVLAE